MPDMTAAQAATEAALQAAKTAPSAPPNEVDQRMLNDGARKTALHLQRVMGKTPGRPKQPMEARLRKGDKIPAGIHPETGHPLYTILEEDEPVVQAVVPNTAPKGSNLVLGIRLTLHDHSVVDIPCGVQPLPKSIFDHWYVQNHGVKEYDVGTAPAISAKEAGETVEQMRTRIREEERQKILAEMAAKEAAKDQPSLTPATNGKKPKLKGGSGGQDQTGDQGSQESGG